jgi:hypothetical protein
MVSYHDINFASALEFAEKMCIPVPENIYIYGIEVRNFEAFSEKLSIEAKNAAARCIEVVMHKINEITNNILIPEKI